MWKGKREFFLAQAQVSVILAIAYIGNNWPQSYPRNDNHNPTMFWVMNICLGIAALLSFKHDENGSARGVQLLSRNQTEEWKGWMQYAFIMYHYYRAYFAYNEIRVFVSAVSNEWRVCCSCVFVESWREYTRYKHLAPMWFVRDWLHRYLGWIWLCSTFQQSDIPLCHTYILAKSCVLLVARGALLLGTLQIDCHFTHSRNIPSHLLLINM